LCEADSERCAVLSAMYSDRPDVSCINSLVDSVSLMEFLRVNQVDTNFDFLSIDIDGADYHLWKGLGDQYCPRVVCIEFNPTVPNHVVFIQENDARIQQGSSLLALKELGSTLGRQFGGYQLVCTTVFNAIFVRQDLMHLIPEGDYSVDSLHSTSMITDIFQTYDGELKLCGPKKLLWHRTAINVQKMQPLPKKQRVFPFAPPESGGRLSSQFSAIETVVAELAQQVNRHIINSELSVEGLTSCLEDLRCVCEESFGAGQAALAAAVDGLLYSVLLAAHTSTATGGDSEAKSHEACGAHIIAVSALLERRGDVECSDKSNGSVSENLYELALQVLAYLTPSMSQYLQTNQEATVARLARKLAGCVGRGSAVDIAGLVKRTYWMRQATPQQQVPNNRTNDAAYDMFAQAGNRKMLVRMGIVFDIGRTGEEDETMCVADTSRRGDDDESISKMYCETNRVHDDHTCSSKYEALLKDREHAIAQLQNYKHLSSVLAVALVLLTATVMTMRRRRS
jgi:hypothetical protein